MKEVKQVIVIRKDLNMRKGKIAAQTAHASLGVVLKFFKKKESQIYSKSSLLATEENYTDIISLDGVAKKGTPMYQWLNGPFTKICVSCDSEGELLELCKKADDLNILNCLITDAGKTEFNNVPTITCAAFGPAYVEELDLLTGHLKLL